MLELFTIFLLCVGTGFWYIKKATQLKCLLTAQIGIGLVIVGIIGLNATWGVLEDILALVEILMQIIPLDQIEEIPKNLNNTNVI
jgi:Na+/phosphate symporter